jgi:hypothetical protein
VRAGFALEVGRLKGTQGLALKVPQREHEILTRLKGLNPGPLDDRAIETIYRAILSESIRIQSEHGLGVVEMPAAQPATRGAARGRKAVRACSSPPLRASRSRASAALSAKKRR